MLVRGIPEMDEITGSSNVGKCEKLRTLVAAAAASEAPVREKRRKEEDGGGVRGKRRCG